MDAIIITGEDLTLEDVVKVARDGVSIELSPDAKEKITASRVIVDGLIAEGAVVYGVTTGFGSLAEKKIPKAELDELQENLLKSHAAGVGDAFPEDVVRAMMLHRINTFAKGLSGVHLSTVEALLGMLNSGVYPIVPSKGSVGASGDLAPLAHLMLVLIGRGEAFVDGKHVSGGDALKKAGLKPVVLDAKEGLALINGTSAMTAVLALTVHDAMTLAKASEIAAAATSEALLANSNAFDLRVHSARPHIGQMKCADAMRRLLQGSTLVDSNPGKVQDCYSIRCIPQVLGASLDTLDYVRSIVEIELNSVTDNPLIFEEGALSGGNFHGQPLALAADFLAIALCEIGSIAERRIARLVDKKHNEGLPAFLIENSGLNSGFMIAQVTAAALVSENKVLAHPASVDSIPTSADQEDHVSMGTFACRKARSILENVEYVVSIELLAALQGLGFRKNQPGKAVAIVRELVREHVKSVKADRELAGDIETVRELLPSIVEAVEKQIGSLS